MSAEQVQKVSRPDRAAFDREMNQLKEELKTCQEAQNKARQAIDTASGGSSSGGNSGDEVWQGLLAELKEAKAQRDEARKSVGAVHNQIKAIDAGIQRKLKEIQTLRPTKAGGPKSESELDALVSKLERQVESGELALVDEKKTLREVTALRRQRKLFGNADKIQAEIDKERAEMTKLRKSIDDSALKAADERIKGINEKLDSHKQQRQAGRKQMDALWTDRRAAQDAVKAVRAKLDSVRSTFNKQQQEWRDWIAAERKQREAEEKAAKAAQAKAKKLVDAQAKLDAAKIPAFTAQIDKANALLLYFGANADDEDANTSTNGLSGIKLGTTRETHKVEAIPEDAKVIKKAETGAAPSRKQLKNQAKASKQPAKNGGSSKAIQLDMSIIEDLASLNIAMPTTTADIDDTKAKLTEKIAFYRANNERVTQERVERAQKEYEKIAAAVDNDESEPEDSNTSSKNAESGKNKSSKKSKDSETKPSKSEESKKPDVKSADVEKRKTETESPQDSTASKGMSKDEPKSIKAEA